MAKQLLFHIVISAFIYHGQGVVNFALNKAATQSTTLFYNNFNWTADKAVDGNSNGSYPDKSAACSATAGTERLDNHTWEVDIGLHIIIKTITVYGRTDTIDVHNQLSGFNLFLGNRSRPWIYNEQLKRNSSQNNKHVFKPKDVIASVIALMRWNTMMTICEVTVEGECVDGMFSEFCNKTCGNCFDGQSCDKKTGVCPHGCVRGWKGPLCNEVCDTGTFGYECNETCGNCFHGNASCFTADGHCSGGCKAGWQGDECKKGCETGRFGYKCNETCGNCFHGDDSCSKVDGYCTGGCKAGWQGDDCKRDSLTILQAASEVIIVGSSIGGAVGVVTLIVVIVIIILKCRRGHKSPRSNIPRAKTLSTRDDDETIRPLNKTRNETNGKKRRATPRQDTLTEAKYSEEEHEMYYYNLGALSKEKIPLLNFWDYVQEKCLDEKYFSREFEKLPLGPQHPTTVALRPENKSKNRYKDVYAYDVNRVVLKPLGNDANDYINASFIEGCSSQRMYIASQGTTKNNIDDFWRMLWEYDVEKIVMLTKLVEDGRHKCDLYWPEKEEQTSTFGSVEVTLLDTDLFADYEIRTLEMSVGNESKRLTHFYYTAWPDKGVPKATSSIVLFRNRVNQIPTNSPIVVHCSAGIGRTGTYIALDSLANKGRTDGYVNVLACVSDLRHQRVNMVQTKEQYIFLHETLVEALMLSGTATTSDKFPKLYQELLEFDRESGKRKLQLEYERLQNEVANHEAVYAAITTDNEEDEGVSKQDEFADAKKPENKAKNRYNDILPADRNRVYLQTSFPGRSDYINAVVLPSHRRRNGFILTQMPLTGTVIDFWRMINDLEVRTIVMLNSETFKAQDMGVYWPKYGETQYGPFSVRLVKQENLKNYIHRALSFSIIGEEYERSVRQFQVTNWSENAAAPENIDTFLVLLDIIESWQNEEKPIVVHCLNGAERSGLYCIISTVIERLKLEKDVAVTQTIKRMRAFRQQIIPNYEQFRFCHECIIRYMKTFETYSNC